MPDRSAILHLNNPDETSALAEVIAARLAPGDVVLLSGDVGAGKNREVDYAIDHLHRQIGTGQCEIAPRPIPRGDVLDHNGSGLRSIALPKFDTMDAIRGPEKQLTVQLGETILLINRVE